MTIKQFMREVLGWGFSLFAVAMILGALVLGVFYNACGGRGP